MVNPDNKVNLIEFSNIVNSLGMVPEAVLSFGKDVFLDKNHMYFRVRPYGNVRPSHFESAEFESTSNMLQEYIFPRIERGMKFITDATEVGVEIQPESYMEKYNYKKPRPAYKIKDLHDGVDFFLMPPTERDLQLTVCSIDQEYINRDETIPVITVIARKGNARIQCFLVGGRKLVPSVNDFGYIIGGDDLNINEPGYQHYGYKNMLKYFRSTGYSSIKEWWQDKYDRKK